MIPTPDNHDDEFLLEVYTYSWVSQGGFPWYYEDKDDEAIDEDFSIRCLGRWRWILRNDICMSMILDEILLQLLVWSI